MKKQYRLVTLIFISIILIQPLVLRAQGALEEEPEYFSFERYRYTYLYFDNFQRQDLRAASLPERRIKQLAGYFVSGFDALRKNKPVEAITQFRKASNALPEYFHTDFIIALTYEKSGQFKKSAQFYKSYLNKLKKFQEGRYRLTQPLIENTVDFEIADYKQAKEMISQRMIWYGVDMRKVSSFRYPALLVVVIVIIIACAILYLIFKTGPIKRISYKIKAKTNRSKELWVCLNCGQENTNINTRCLNCGKDA